MADVRANILAVFLIGCLVLNTGAQDIVQILPSPDKLPGWTIQQGPEVFAGDHLFSLIDGGADVYFEYGFSQVVSVDYIDQRQNITEAEIYEMTDANAAYGIFSLSQQAVEWSRVYGQLSVITSDYIAFWKDRYYVIISWASRQNSGSGPMETLAELISGKIPGEGSYPDLLTGFRALSPEKRVVYLKGNLALSNFYYFDYKDIFELEEAIACSPGDHHRIVIRYADASKALAVFSAAKQHMISNKRFTDVAMVYQGFTCRDNKGNPLLVRQEDRYIIVLVSLKPGTALNPLMDEIIQKIEEMNNR